MRNTKGSGCLSIAFLMLIMMWVLLGCQGQNKNKNFKVIKKEDNSGTVPDLSFDYDTSQWWEITTDNSGILLDIRYATTNNFTDSVIYDCGRCFLRPEIAAKLMVLNRGIEERYNLRLKVFDCYRPKPAQQRLWDFVPDPSYVTPPDKGSMHNRGMAVDITLVDYQGNELDMGTGYDHFGVEAHTDNNELPDLVLRNRRILQSMMEEIGFRKIRTEWWHFSYRGEVYPLSDWQWKCPPPAG